MRLFSYQEIDGRVVSEVVTPDIPGRDNELTALAEAGAVLYGSFDHETMELHQEFRLDDDKVIGESTIPLSFLGTATDEDYIAKFHEAIDQAYGNLNEMRASQ